jgi:hypothetical protein
VQIGPACSVLTVCACARGCNYKRVAPLSTRPHPPADPTDPPTCAAARESAPAATSLSALGLGLGTKSDESIWRSWRWIFCRTLSITGPVRGWA